MTLGKVIVLSIIGIFAAFMIAFFLPMAHSYGAEVCYTEAAFAADAQAHGDTVAGTVRYHGKLSDTLVIVESTKGIMGVAFKAGCLVTPVPLDDYAGPETPTVAKPEGGA